jgi:SPX domain protein involved in polyphosphate accumulation
VNIKLNIESLYCNQINLQKDKDYLIVVTLMKFGKSLSQVISLSNPEWGPFWINYKYLKMKINDIVAEQGGKKCEDQRECNPQEISKSISEVEFFRLIRKELKKVSDFFHAAEQLCTLRKDRITNGFAILKELEIVVGDNMDNKDAWKRLLASCVRFYKDVLLLENFAIMNYCGFSKILKKHDKLTG